MQTIERLKSHAYDCLVNIESWQKELKATNELILNYKSTPTETPETPENVNDPEKSEEIKVDGEIKEETLNAK